MHRTLISPLLLFPLLWTTAAVVSLVLPLNSSLEWTWMVTAVVIVVPVAFVIGGLIATSLVNRFPSISWGWGVPCPELTLRLLLLVFVIIGWAELIHQYVAIGGVPLLSPRGNELRLEQGGPTIILTNLLTVTALVAFTRPRHLFSRPGLFYLFIGLLAIAGFITQLGRGSIVLVVVAAVLARWLYWGRPRWQLMLGAGVTIFLIVVGVFFFRVFQNPYRPFEATLIGEDIPDLPLIIIPLIPFYYGIVPNFHVLTSLVNYFPAREGFGGGKFNGVGLDLFIPGTENLSEITSSLTAPWVTGTVAGPLWADGGFVWVIVGMAVIGFLAVGIFVKAVRTRHLGWCLGGGYVIYLTTFGIYQSLWTQQIDWVLVLPLLLAIGAIGQLASNRSTEETPSDRSQAAPPPSSERNTGGLGKTGVLVTGVAVLGLLLVAGAVIQRSLPAPLGPSESTSLPPNTPPPRDLMTNGLSKLENEPIFWLLREGSAATLVALPPSVDGRPERLGQIDVGSPRATSLDVASWSDWRAIALFELTPSREWIEVRISPSRRADGPPESYRTPFFVSANTRVRDLSLASWSGPETDLFALTCTTDDEACLIRVFSGESGFRKEIAELPLPFKSLPPQRWSIEIGGGTPPNLFLIHHSPEVENSEILVLSSRNNFAIINFKRNLSLKSKFTSPFAFLLGREEGTPSVYFVQMAARGTRDRVTIFPIPLPIGL